jgi:hypothetical protein
MQEFKPSITSSQNIRLAFQSAQKQFISLVRSFAIELLGLFVVQVFIDETVEYLTAQFRNGKEQSFLSILLIFLFLMMSEFFVGNALLLIAAKQIRNFKSQGREALDMALSGQDLRSFEKILIEELRAAGEVLTGFIMFIFPGFNRLIHYFFVPFVVLFDEDYLTGKIDALKASKEVSLSHFWFISTLLTATAIIDWLLGYIIKGSEDSILKDPVHVGLAAGVALLLNLFFKLFYCFIYLNLKSQHPTEK